jgi:hypothetical protein
MKQPMKKRPSWDTIGRITRADIKIPGDSGKTAKQLQTEIDRTKPRTTNGSARRTAPRSALHVAENVFQWRGNYRRDQWTRNDHIHTLARAVRDSGKPLKRLLVMPVAEKPYVIDGHHRLAAYDTARWTKVIPVEVFAGSLTEARVRALTGNVKDKLPMTTQAKSEAAWTITKENLGKPTAEQVRDWTQVSIRQVRFMRKVWREINERKDVDRTSVQQLTWKKARDAWEGKDTDTDFDQESWIEKKAQQVVAQINNHNLAKGLLEDTEVTALVLRTLSEKLPGRANCTPEPEA